MPSLTAAPLKLPNSSTASNRSEEGRLPDLFTAGEFYFDLIFYGLPALPRLGEELNTNNFALALGGGAVISALTAAKLGRKVELVSVLGDSVLDAFALAELRRAGVSTRFLKQQRRMMGGITVAVSVRQDRYFLTYPGANVLVQRHLLSPAVRRQLGRARHVHLGLSPRRWEPFSRLVAGLRRRGVTISWDLGWHPEAANQPGFRRFCALLDIIFFNRDEALHYSGAVIPEAALARLSRPGQCCVIKLGSQGAVAVGPDGRQSRVGGLRVQAIETTGAGDAFNGGFLHAWLDGAHLVDCLRLGNACGALSTTAPGGTTGTLTRAKLERILRQRQ